MTETTVNTEAQAKSAFTKCEFTDAKENVLFSFPCDRFSINREGGGVLLSLSGICTLNEVSLLRMALKEKRKIYVVCRTRGRYGPIRRVATRHDDGYDIHVHRLPYGNYHVVLIAKAGNMLMSRDPENLWNLLMTERYTTPLLKHWMPWLYDELKSLGKILPTWSNNSTTAILKLTTPELDKLVERGIRSGALVVGRETESEETESEENLAVS